MKTVEHPYKNSWALLIKKTGDYTILKSLSIVESPQKRTKTIQDHQLLRNISRTA